VNAIGCTIYEHSVLNRIGLGIFIMASMKRKLPNVGLQRRVRARVEPDPDPVIEETSDDEAPSEEDLGDEIDGSGSESEKNDDAVSF
jgi:hypothetical protein